MVNNIFQFSLDMEERWLFTVNKELLDFSHERIKLISSKGGFAHHSFNHQHQLPLDYQGLDVFFIGNGKTPQK